MKRFIEGQGRDQATLFPECLEDWIEEDNTVRVVDAYVDGLDLGGLGFAGVDPKSTGRPAYHPAVLLKLYIYGYLNAVQSSRRLEREAGRNVEVMWLLGRLVPDHKTIVEFRRNNGPAIRKVCALFVDLCRRLGLLAEASVAMDGSKFKAVNNRDRNFTANKMKRRMVQIEESIARYLHQLESADRQERSKAKAMRINRLNEKIDKLHAICVVCGDLATRNQRLIDGRPAPAEGPTIQVGGLESYEARCRAHHVVPSTLDDQMPLISDREA